MESGRLTVIAGIDKITFNFFSIIVEQCAIFAEASYVKAQSDNHSCGDQGHP